MFIGCALKVPSRKLPAVRPQSAKCRGVWGLVPNGPKITLLAESFFSPKGCNSLAQARAQRRPGNESPIHAEALKGRNILQPEGLKQPSPAQSEAPPWVPANL